MLKFISEKVYSNRYRDEYKIVKVDENIYKFEMKNLEYCRWGGKEDQKEIDMNDLGMFDPSGGPFLEPGQFEIDGRKVIRLFSNEYIGFEVEHA